MLTLFDDFRLLRIYSPNLNKKIFFTKKNLILFGPNYFNIKDSANLLIDNDIAYVVNSEKELLGKIKSLINNWNKTKEKANRAEKIVKDQKGSIGKTKKRILDFLV